MEIANKANNFYIFKSENVCDKLDNILHKKGLSITEREDFITFWMSKLVSKKYVMISFMDDTSYNSLNQLVINPIPGKIIRVCMIFKSIDSIDQDLLRNVKVDSDEKENEIIVRREEIKSELVVEWGGINLK